MDGTIIVQWAMTGLLAVGLIATWIRNGKSQSRKYGQLEEKLDTVKKSVDRGNATTEEVKKEIKDFRIHCADTVASFREQIKGNKEQIKEMKDDKREEK